MRLLAGVGIVEQTMLAQAPIEGGRRQLAAGEESFLEQPSIQHRVRQLALLVGGQRGQHLADGLGQLGTETLRGRPRSARVALSRVVMPCFLKRYSQVLMVRQVKR